MRPTLVSASLPLLLLLAAGGAQAADPVAGQDAATRFAALDVNHDGVVSKYEYDTEVLISLMDTNNDLHVSADELQAFLGPQDADTPSAAKLIGIADVNGDGQLDQDELDRRTKMRFEWLDTNSDGNVDLPELKVGLATTMRRW